MKIDKVIFSSSEQYADFWPTISRVFKENLQIEPVCLLFADDNFSISEEYGEVRRLKFIEGLPKIIQITWSKFYYTKHELDTTWMIGDIDQIPLQKSFFFETIKDISDIDYVHLNYDGCGQTLGRSPDLWLADQGERGGGFDLPAHYHVAKGSVFKEVLDLNLSFEDQIRILTSGKYGLGTVRPVPKGTERFFWIAEEQYSSDMIREKVKDGKVQFHGFSYNNSNNTQRINRSVFPGQYVYDVEKLLNGGFVDIHCHRPFAEQAAQLEQILSAAFKVDKK